jgi:hypothetical protein
MLKEKGTQLKEERDAQVEKKDAKGKRRRDSEWMQKDEGGSRTTQKENEGILKRGGGK